MLLERSASGDRNAFRQLYSGTAGSVFRLVERLLQDPAQAEEVVQEVFLDVWLTADRYATSRGPVLPWLHTIARRRGIDRVRASQSSRERDHRAGMKDWPVPFDDVTDTISAFANAAELHTLLMQLPAPARRLVTLTHLDGHSHTHVADLLGIPTGTVKSRLHDAMHTLRRLARTT
ncbi:hypothetical protein AX769_21745 (plasmid) [Frondihabitans sp. PAMC 28766]|uniref:sigma-70 family RNA polymerase sigma factor n=1 Tax=Frondihabitans sp. PAMC 28766 TaxID=1795630 RepID=UPI00078E4136|nr:sigma-70 family RNA polymerase sigma factor [Frondihabitans sp. PAMC 28766]AMM22766.1 hypothetical protein AX769_21745 [Frondihabitans sp. PAMC 28766]